MKKLWLFFLLCSLSFGVTGQPIAFAGAPGWLQIAPTGPTSGLQVLSLIENLINWLFVGFMLLAVVILILAGWQFITGGGDPQNVAKARSKLLWAVIAIAIAVTAQGIPIVARSILGV